MSITETMNEEQLIELGEYRLEMLERIDWLEGRKKRLQARFDDAYKTKAREYYRGLINTLAMELMGMQDMLWMFDERFPL